MKNVLIAVDVQNDFCPGGSLAVEDGELIIPQINRLVNCDRFDFIIATQDWHTENHISFASTHKCSPFETVQVDYGDQRLWPDHCVQGSAGAQFHSLFDDKKVQFIIRKGFRKNIDSYSAFFENDKVTSTGLNALIGGLVGEGDFRLVIAGIATDVCVYYTAIDARSKLHYHNVVVAIDACAGISKQGVDEAVKKMEFSGIQCKSTEAVITDMVGRK